jgi:hypothetical protein
VVRFGFELTVEDSQGNKVGTLQLTDATRTKFTNGGDAVTHTDNGITPTGNSNSWSVDWVAPIGVSGNIGIYAAFNAANGNGNTSGDVIYKSSIFISPFIPVPAITSITPNEAGQGETVITTIVAENTSFFGSNPVVNFSFDENPGEVIVGLNVIVVNNNTLKANFNIPSDASAGLWDVHVDGLLLDKGFTVNVVSGIGDGPVVKARIYPNPATERFFVEDAPGLEVSVYNSNGMMVTSETVSSEKYEINISNLSSGIYFVRLGKGNNTRVEKLVIN